MVVANNIVRLRKIQSRVLEDQQTFWGINHISICITDRILCRNGINMKQVSKIPFKRNSNQIKTQLLECPNVQVGLLRSHTVILGYDAVNNTVMI